MKRLSMPLLVASLVLAALLPVQARAGAEVTFVRPERFMDLGDSDRDRESTMALIASHIKQQTQRYAPGDDLAIEFTDIDLAGVIEPVGPRMERMRVLRSITWPRLEFRYVVSRGGEQTLQGEARLSDMSYQDHVFGHMNTDPIRFEKQLIDDWFKRTFATGKTQ